MFFFAGLVDLIEEIDVVGVVQFIPFRNGGDGAAAALGECGGDFLAQVGVEDFADADHGGILSTKITKIRLSTKGTKGTKKKGKT